MWFPRDAVAVVVAWALTASSSVVVNAFVSPQTKSNRQQYTVSKATISPMVEAAESATIKNVVLDQWKNSVSTATDYAESFGFSHTEAGLFGLVHAMRTSGIAYGLKGFPFVLRKEEIESALQVAKDSTLFDGFYTMSHLETALEEDFLDAARGSTDNRKGWKVRIYYCDEQ